MFCKALNLRFAKRSIPTSMQTNTLYSLAFNLALDRHPYVVVAASWINPRSSPSASHLRITVSSWTGWVYWTFGFTWPTKWNRVRWDRSAVVNIFPKWSVSFGGCCEFIFRHTLLPDDLNTSAEIRFTWWPLPFARLSSCCLPFSFPLRSPYHWPTALAILHSSHAMRWVLHLQPRICAR